MQICRQNKIQLKGEPMTLKDLFTSNIIYSDDDFVILNPNNQVLIDNRNRISPILADYTDLEVTRIRLDAQKGLIIKVR